MRWIADHHPESAAREDFGKRDLPIKCRWRVRVAGECLDTTTIRQHRQAVADADLPGQSVPRCLRIVAFPPQTELAERHGQWIDVNAVKLPDDAIAKALRGRLADSLRPGGSQPASGGQQKIPRTARGIDERQHIRRLDAELRRRQQAVQQPIAKRRRRIVAAQLFACAVIVRDQGEVAVLPQRPQRQKSLIEVAQTFAIGVDRNGVQFAGRRA